VVLAGVAISNFTLLSGASVGRATRRHRAAAARSESAWAETPTGMHRNKAVTAKTGREAVMTRPGNEGIDYLGI
jgi:hypothetical protein